MRYRYWTVQARPTPTSITTIGIGVIVEEPSTGELAHRFIERPQALLSRYSDSASAAPIIRDLEHWLERTSLLEASLDIDERFAASGLLDSMVHRWNNLITINPKQYMSANSISDAVDLLFGKLISNSESTHRTRRVTQVRQNVRSAYENKEPLRELIITRPILTIDEDLSERFDLGVIRDSTIFELNDAFSMHSNDPRQTENRIQAWTWKMTALRSFGAQLIKPDGTSVEVDSQTPIVATLWPPTTKTEHKLYSTMTRRWDKLGISYIEIGDIESHAEKLSHRAA